MNFHVFGGSVRAAGPPPVAGVVSTPGSLLRLYLAEMRRAPWEVPASATVVTPLRSVNPSGGTLKSPLA